MRTLFVAGLVFVGACSKSPSTPPADQPEPAAQPDVEAGDDHPSMTAAQCEAQGGQIIGDIGDGAIHQPGYRCPESGAPPVGSIAPDPDGAMAVEGSVCCK
jgi:hypothetical protein